MIHLTKTNDIATLTGNIDIRIQTVSKTSTTKSNLKSKLNKFQNGQASSGSGTSVQLTSPASSGISYGKSKSL